MHALKNLHVHICLMWKTEPITIIALFSLHIRNLLKCQISDQLRCVHCQFVNLCLMQRRWKLIGSPYVTANFFILMILITFNIIFQVSAMTEANSDSESDDSFVVCLDGTADHRHGSTPENRTVNSPASHTSTSTHLTPAQVQYSTYGYDTLCLPHNHKIHKNHTMLPCINVHNSLVKICLTITQVKLSKILDDK